MDGIVNNQRVENSTERHLGDTANKKPLKKRLQKQMKKKY